MPRSEEVKPVEFADGEGPQRGDLVIYFPPLFETQAEAAMTPEEYMASMRAASLTRAPLPCKRTLEPDSLQPRRLPDPELDELAEVRARPELRPLTAAEMHGAADRLLRTGHLFARGVVRDVLQNGTVPVADGDEYPKPEFGMSDKGTLLFRLLRAPNETPRWREAKPADLDTWPTTFRTFAEHRIALCEKKLADEGNG
jgi:hypothetical protein